MLSAIITTGNSERALVPTLAALVPGATAGLIKEVIVVDGGSRDATAEVADIAGCRFMAPGGPLGTRLSVAAAAARAPWLMFLRAGAIPEPGWIDTVERFMTMGELERAAVFARRRADRPQLREALELLLPALAPPPKSGQGLIIAKSFYERLGAHPSDGDAEMRLLRKIGRRRITVLGHIIAPDT